MEEKYKICPYSNEKFIPRRNNQKYASAYNRVAFNNEKYRKFNKSIKEFNKKLLKNKRIMDELLQDKKELTVETAYMRGKGYSFEVLTHLMNEDNKTIYGIYNYAFFKLDDNTIKIIKQ